MKKSKRKRWGLDEQYLSKQQVAISTKEAAFSSFSREWIYIYAEWSNDERKRIVLWRLRVEWKMTFQHFRCVCGKIADFPLISSLLLFRHFCIYYMRKCFASHFMKRTKQKLLVTNRNYAMTKIFHMNSVSVATQCQRETRTNDISG